MHWSKTRHVSYKTCPRQFFYANVAGPRNPEIAKLAEQQAPPLLRHEVVREILLDIMRGGSGAVIDRDAFLERGRDYLLGVIGDEFQVNAQMSIVELCVDNFIRLYFEEIQSAVVVYVSDGKPVEFVYDGVSMMVLPELVLDRDAYIQLISWKTGTSGFRKDDDFFLRAGGLTCWARSVLRCLDRPVVVTEVFLRNDCAAFEICLDDRQVTEFVANARAVAAEYSISAKLKNFPANPSLNGCRFCAYTSICPGWQDFAESDYSLATLSTRLSGNVGVAPDREEKLEKAVFLSHVSDDIDQIVRPFARLLEAQGVTYWLDEAAILWGDSLSKSINAGLRSSRYLVCFITDKFLGRGWPEGELGAALSSELSGKGQRVLPVLVADPEAVFYEYPLLRDKKVVRWSPDMKELSRELKALLSRDKLGPDFG
ncbi:MAG TPA: TIR domain-containing protein [Thermoanaerobaculia bacterium]|jgi:hypothetical protein|nr:TIR domain-containing protein [Thermoanaerobaculia bacterium]